MKLCFYISLFTKRKEENDKLLCMSDLMRFDGRFRSLKYSFQRSATLIGDYSVNPKLAERAYPKSYLVLNTFVDRLFSNVLLGAALSSFCREDLGVLFCGIMTWTYLTS